MKYSRRMRFSSTIVLGAVGMTLAFGGCSAADGPSVPGELTGEGDNAVQESPESTSESEMRDPRGEAIGFEATVGAPEHAFIGWRSSQDARELLLDDVRRLDFERRVEEIVGENPFQISTAAGSIAVGRGVDPGLLRRLAGARQHDELVVQVVPTLPVQQRIEAQLEADGLRILSYQAPNTYVAKGSPSAIRRAAESPLIYGITERPPHLKIEPRLGSSPGLASSLLDDIEAGGANVVVYDLADAQAATAAIEGVGGTVEHIDDELRLLKCKSLDIGAIRALAEIPTIAFIDAAWQAHTSLDTSVSLCGNHTAIRDAYTYGSGVALGMIDTGFEADHAAFGAQSGFPALNYTGWNVSGEGQQWNDNPLGHGTAVGGIMLSRWAVKKLAGMAPRSGGDAAHAFRVVRTGKDSNTTALYNTDAAIDDLTADNVAEVINNSWSSKVYTGTDSTSIKVDAAVWKTRQTFVFAAGNYGPSAGTVGAGAAGKNTIGVGNVNNGTLALQSDSSEGPTTDGRAKPDIYAPGTFITTMSGSNLSGAVEASGTSFAAPHVTGVLSTLMDHYPSLLRRPATAKAYLMASAARKSWLPARTGVLNSWEAHWTTATTQGNWGWYDADPRPFTYIYWDFTIPNGVKDMVVVLTWIEPAGATGAAKAVSNNVDLWVDINKDNGEFGEWSSTSTVDNVEVVHLTNPSAGEYRVKARKVSAAVDYRPGIGLFYRK